MQVKVPWRPLRFAIVLLLSLATAATVFWQHRHVAVLWDLAYVLDSASRIAGGALPYRDFPFAHAPLTFLIQAAILKVFGRAYWHVQLYTALAGAAGTALTFLFLLQLLRDRIAYARATAVLLALPLTVLGLYTIFPFPSYDCDGALSVLFALFLLHKLSTGQKPQLWFALFTGAALVLPLFFKQNIGLPLLGASAATLAGLLLLQLAGWSKAETLSARTLGGTLAGMGAALVFAAILVQSTCGIENYLHWTVGFAMQRRMVGSAVMLSIYHQQELLWMLPSVALGAGLLCFGSAKRWKQIAACVLLLAPLFYPVVGVFLYDDADSRGDLLLALWPLLLVLAALVALAQLRHGLTLRAAIPLLMLTAIHGTLLSQQIWGSTYALWSFFSLLTAELILAIRRLRGSAPWIPPTLAGVTGVVLLLCGGLYTASEERLSYAAMPEETAVRATLPELAGMAAPGPYLPQFEELLRYVRNNIPTGDGILLLPGEDPFYYATGRRPRFPVLLFDPATDPLSPRAVRDEARRCGIKWLILKKDQQIKEDPMPFRAETLAFLLPDYKLAATLRGYEIYREQKDREQGNRDQGSGNSCSLVFHRSL
jgi:hypothetical protein